MSEQRQWTLVHGDGNRVVAQGDPLYEDEVALVVVPESELSLSLAREQALREAVEDYLLWEPGKRGHAAAHEALRLALSSPRGEG